MHIIMYFYILPAGGALGSILYVLRFCLLSVKSCLWPLAIAQTETYMHQSGLRHTDILGILGKFQLYFVTWEPEVFHTVIYPNELQDIDLCRYFKCKYVYAYRHMPLETDSVRPVAYVYMRMRVYVQSCVYPCTAIAVCNTCGSSASKYRYILHYILYYVCVYKLQLTQSKLTHPPTSLMFP